MSGYYKCKILICLLVALVTVAGANIYTEKAEYTVNEEIKPKVAITFDDGPHKKYTELLLDGLLVRNVKATFFLIGKNIEGNEKIVNRMSEEGHLIGNHTYSHIQLNNSRIEKDMDEICKTNSIIEKITGKKVKYIRPPYGFWNRELDRRISMEKVKWTVDPRDWSVLNSKCITRYIVGNVKDGDIILLHDIYPTSVEAALDVIDRLQEKGFEFVTLEEMDVPLWPYEK